MKTRTNLALRFALPLTLAVITAGVTLAQRRVAPARPQGPCDAYAAGGDSCVAAHSTTRALYASYNSPLYQVLRQSDGKTLDIGVVQPVASPVPDPGGYANAVAQNAFCANTYCWITKIYDQSPKQNHLIQAPRGGFSGPDMGGFNNLPVADMAPITIMVHKGLALDTGGLWLHNENNLEHALERLSRDNGSYYVLGYDVSTGEPEGHFTVRVKRPGVTVRARRSVASP